jgi:GxxExxY protein
MDVEMLIRAVMECSKNIRRVLGPGYLESVYKNSMLVELNKRGFVYETEKPISVYYENVLVGIANNSLDDVNMLLLSVNMLLCL